MESKIQSQIIKKFERAGWMVVKLIATNTNGIPDLMCLRAGRVLFIEVKRPGGKLSELQEYRIRKLREQSFQVLIIDDHKKIIV